MADVPPYQLQHLISVVVQPSVPDSGLAFGRSRRDSKTTPPKVEVTCSQALGSEIYIGCSDGSLLRFALQADNPNEPESYKLLSSQTLSTGKAIDEITLAPSISRALILSGHQIFFYTIPSLDPVQIPPIRNVVHFAIDEQHLHRPQPSSADTYAQVEPIEFCVIKRSNVAMYSLRERLYFQQEIPMPQGARLARRTGRFLCFADKENYNMIDLQAASLVPILPICQIFEDDVTATPRPSITVINDDEFLILSSMGATTMGVFITSAGDPVRGTLEWPSHPDALCLDYPYVAALLPNKTIEIHSLETQAIVQVISTFTSSTPPSSPSSLKSIPEPRCLAMSQWGYLVPSTERTDRLRLTLVPLVVPSSSNSSSRQSTPSAGSDTGDGNERPSYIPVPPRLLSKTMTPVTARPPVFPRSHVLVLSENSVQSLLPSTLISQAESLLESHKVDETVDLADQNQRKLLGTMTADEDQAEEIKYVYQRVGFQYFEETLFDDAGKHLFAGDVDPRLILRYFPDLRGNLFEPTAALPVYAGVAEHLPPYGSVEDIVRNYSPHLAPNTRTAPPTAELRRMLTVAARDMLAAYLRKCRTRRLLDRTNSNPLAVNEAVDTVLVRILAESEDTEDLYNIIDGPNNVLLSEVERVLTKNGQYNALCKLYEKAGDEGKLLDAWSQVADGVWTDEHIPDPLDKMSDLLYKTSNRALVQHWGVWLTKRDAGRGLKLIISRDSKRSSKADDAAMLDQITRADPAAGTRYAEYLVLQKRSLDNVLHTRLATSCAAQLTQALEDPSTSKLWRAKASSYGSNRNDTPFLSYFATTTPESDHKRTRLKAALFFQGSNLYDVEDILERLQEHQKVLSLEVAILFGKLGRHQEALSTLVHQVHDATSAEAYCTLGGDVIPGKVAHSLGVKYDLQGWAALVPGGASMDARQKMADEATTKDLLRVLLKVYMDGGSSTADSTACLLNSQAINLDVVDVLSLVPPDWSLNKMSSFLARSFRRTLHARHEGQILKSISAGQNLEVSDKTWLIMREQGSIIEEALDDDSSEKGSGDNVNLNSFGQPQSFSEKSLAEKTGLHEDDVNPIAIPNHPNSKSSPSNNINITEITTGTPSKEVAVQGAGGNGGHGGLGLNSNRPLHGSGSVGSS